MTRSEAGSQESSRVETDGAEDGRPIRTAQFEALKRDVAAGLRSILEGRVSHATPRDIKGKALRRKAIK